MIQLIKKSSSILLLISIIELFIRYILGIGDPILFKADPKLEYEQIPSQKVKVFHNNIFINSLGMKSDEIEIPKSKNIKRILVYGDSVIFGGNLLSNKSMATNFLKNMLKSERYKYEVVNISSGSWGPGNWLAHIKDRGIYDADHVLIVLNSNDLYDIPTFEAIETNPLYPSKKPLSASIFFVRRYIIPKIKNLFKEITRDILNIINKDNLITKKDKSKLTKEKENSLGDLEEIIYILKNKEVGISVIQFWDREEFIKLQPKKSNLLIREILERNEIDVLQSGYYFRNCSSNPSHLYIDNIHPYKQKAQKCLANLMKKSITRNSKLEIIKN